MTTAPGARAGRRGVFARRPWLHLLWALPLALFPALVAFGYAVVNECGISGCSGGGFGVSRGDPRETYGALAIAALLLAVPGALVPWHPRLRVRAAWALAGAVAVVGGAWLLWP